MSDVRTANAFAESWNHIGSVYTREQFLEWLEPLTPADFYLRRETVDEWLCFGGLRAPA